MVHAKSERTVGSTNVYTYIHARCKCRWKESEFCGAEFHGEQPRGVNAISSLSLAYSSLEKYLKRVLPLVILARGARGNPLEDFESSFFADRVAPRVSFKSVKES